MTSPITHPQPDIHRPRRKFIARLGAVLFGLLLALLIVEIAIRLLYGQLPMGVQIALRDVRVHPFTDSRLAPPPLWQSDRDYLTIVRPGARDSLQAGSPTVTFRVDTFAWWGGRVGFRSPQPEDGKIEAVALGDSFTFCFTHVENCWVKYAAQQSGLRIENLGQPVTGSVSHARRYFDFVAKPELKLQQPKVVIWQFYGNDFNDDYGLAVLNGTNRTPATAQAAPPALSQGEFAVALRQQSALYALMGVMVRGRDPGVEQFVDPHTIKKDGLELSFGQSYIRNAFDMTLARNQEGEQRSQRAILETRDLVQRNGGQFFMVVMPTKEEAYAELTAPILGADAIAAIAAPRLRMLDFCRRSGLRCFDALPILKAHADNNLQVYFPADPHLNMLGNQVVGSAVAQFIRVVPDVSARGFH